MVQFLAKGLRGRKHGLRLPEKDFSPIYCCILDQYLGNRHAPLLSGGFCLEAAGGPGGHAPPVGSNLQSHPGVLLVQELPVDPETDPVKGAQSNRASFLRNSCMEMQQKGATAR